MRIFILAMIVAMSGLPCAAQTVPTAGQIAEYEGLFAAAYSDDAAAIAALIADGADPNVRNARGRTPAHVAAFASHEAALEALAAGGADLNLLDGERYDVVTIAAVANDPKMVSAALCLGNRPDLITSVYDGTALIAAAHLGHAEVVRRLIDAGAPLDHVNNLGWTALIEAVILGDGGPNHQATVRALVEAGADRSIGDRRGVTPLEHAKARGYDEMVRILEGE